jgi:putative hydrolase of the HAD superfamily
MTPLPRRSELRALLLDLDDTILDDRSGIRGAWELIAGLIVEAHADLEREAVRREIGRATAWFWSDDDRHRRGRLDLPRARQEIVERVLDVLGRPDAELAWRCGERYTEHREASYRLAEGAWEALGRLRDAIPLLALVTNGAALPQRAKVERFGLAPFFDHVQIEGEFGAGKPDRVVFEHVLERLGAPPEASLMVGDNYEADVLGGLGAGLHAAWIEHTGERAPPLPAPRAHATLRSLAELARRLGV